MAKVIAKATKCPVNDDFYALRSEKKKEAGTGKCGGYLWRELSLEKMTSEDTCLTRVHGIVAGETPNVRDLSFRDPDCFQSG